MSKHSAFFILLSVLLVIQFSDVKAVESTEPNTKQGKGSLLLEECAPACNVRCSETSHKKPCKFFCNYCCKKCLCVPSGTYGHKEECSCYNDMKTKEGKPKCP